MSWLLVLVVPTVLHAGPRDSALSGADIDAFHHDGGTHGCRECAMAASDQQQCQKLRKLSVRKARVHGHCDSPWSQSNAAVYVTNPLPPMQCCAGLREASVPAQAPEPCPSFSNEVPNALNVDSWTARLIEQFFVGLPLLAAQVIGWTCARDFRHVPGRTRIAKLKGGMTGIFAVQSARKFELRMERTLQTIGIITRRH